ncbi:MAG: SusD/RagB family nutrient-binding outer membrane lipoprotein [Cyclobacteriaceae bacterium]|nr:SusD/RagB family nutrient-binding outer membrane lipoprotein [Cyclobacteriaceae bacterium]MCB0500737.1 SusD/RagB family nutrient-binding outer membrane lipoprotein [Cyclobacteriaceae bacterium]MCB9238173.1 SusD/RagB family nutrient-binding outer membrane lipoprotein [Flammeovirgaceae bacterium]MCO5272967.1 SusD/RagB family nutrient-binding outer membrane lipoprotein [Cyclobacteriaceae bacterium]MCW5901503.1 SusD/RagB family nutrient-binding outer membrane lipoprotein [Cyclobacteriaceae bacte
MKIGYKILSMVAVMALVMSCDLSKDLDNPNEVGASEANPDLLMNKIQTDFGLFFNKVAGVSDRNVSELVRMKAMTGADTYNRAYTAQGQNEVWQDAYQKILINIETMIPLADESEQNVHLGIGKILKAYVYLTVVDLYGDVPYSEALKGDEGILNPKVDGGASVYTACIALLNEAKADLANTAGTGIARDIFYNGSRAKWTTLANSLELKAQLNLAADASNTAAKSAVQALITANDLIDTDAEEFTYKYGTSSIPSISRSPGYQDHYAVTKGSGGGYLGNYFLYQMYRDPNLKVQDPRWRYYFYRKVGSKARALADDSESVPCALTAPPDHYTAEGQPFCTFEPGFYGRDHGNADGSPADARATTAVGAYPYGGRIDLNDGDPNYADATQQGQGGNGAGIEPIYMSWFTDFMKAEAVVRLGLPGDAKALMLSGVTKSINRVRSFSNSIGQALPAGLEPSQVTYLATLGAFFDTAADQQDVILKEYYKSLWGNGLEAYNLYRRTGSPKMMQPTRSINGGDFVYTMVYPANFVNLNGSVDQKPDNSTRVFWDVNGFVLR